jgi:magnesium chelatase subunit I
VRTHYPLDVETEVEIIRQEAAPFEAVGIDVAVPDHMLETIATLSQLARSSPHISQRSGVSVRLSVSNYEVMVANAARRTLLAGESEVVPRICDLEALPAATAGKVEIETLEEGRDEQILDHLVRAAVLQVFRERVGPEQLVAVVTALEERGPVETGEDVPSERYTSLVAEVPSLGTVVTELAGREPSPGAVAAAVEFLLEGLHLSKRLNKDAVGGRAQYRTRG